MPIRKRETDEKALMEKQWRSNKIASGVCFVQWRLKDNELVYRKGRMLVLKCNKAEKSHG